METLASLHDDGFLDVAMVRNGVGRLEGATVRRITPKGLRAVRQWPEEDVTAELLLALQTMIDSETDPVKKSRLERARDVLGELTKSVVAALVAAGAKGAVGLE